MQAQFTSVSLLQSEEYYTYWNLTPTHSLDYTLANLWGWERYFGLEWWFDDELCWIRQTRPNLVLWAPLGPWGKIAWNKARFQMLGETRQFTRVPEDLVSIWEHQLEGKISAEEERGQWEYLYNKDELVNLPGNRYHKKKNHLNSYIKTYGEPDYHEITPDMVQDVLGVQNDWCQWHECDDSPSLRAENEAINRVLTHWDKFRNFYGGCLEIDNKMIAFSVGEKLDSETLGVHFEKGLNGYKGVYQAMNSEFARHAGRDLKFVNRAQDMDEEGLRQAKMTYLPVGFLKKFAVTIL